MSNDTDALRTTQASGECTSNSCVSQERDDHFCHPEMDEIIRNLDLNDVVNPSPSQGSNINQLLCQELEDFDSPLYDIFNSKSSQKNSMVYDSS